MFLSSNQAVGRDVERKSGRILKKVTIVIKKKKKKQKEK